MKKKKILIIEDEQTLLMAIKSKMELEGYDVAFAEDGEEGYKLINEYKPDLILLDILLPKKDGFQILEDLKKGNNKIPVIIVSNSGQAVEIDRALKLGVKDYLVKADFSPDEVLEKVKKMIGPGIKDDLQEETELIEEEEIESPTQKSAHKVLIIEDDQFLREVISQKLSKEGFDVSAAIDAVSAFGAIKTKSPHVILLDLILPGIDGFDFLKQIKKTNVDSRIPVIVLSNLGQQNDKDKAMNLGATDYLIKANSTPDEIVQKIREVISKKYL